MNPTSVRNLLLSLGLAGGLGAAVSGCSSHENPGGTNGTGGFGGGDGLGGNTGGLAGHTGGPGGNSLGGYTGGNGLGGYTGGGPGGISGSGGNALRGGAPGQLGDPAEAGADTGDDAMSSVGNDGSASSDADPAGG